VGGAEEHPASKAAMTAAGAAMRRKERYCIDVSSDGALWQCALDGIERDIDQLGDGRYLLRLPFVVRTRSVALHMKVVTISHPSGRVVLVTVHLTRGSVPREEGAWMLVSSQAIEGTVGGGHV
jgi:hypothetical protein